jgi:hypothetical protein
LIDQCSVFLYVCLCQVLKLTSATPDHQQQASTAVVIVWVRLQVFSQMIDFLGQQYDLNL